MFRPPQLVRRISPLAGLPRITIRVRPCHSYGKPATDQPSIGSNHIRYHGIEPVLRLTTDAPLSYITEETSFALTRPVTLIFGPDEPFTSAIDVTAREFVERTRDFWRDWVRIPRRAVRMAECRDARRHHAQAVHFEETGAIVAAHTTSIPEAPGSGRNWDYRYCWLRDAYFVVEALNRLGATRRWKTTSTTSPRLRRS